MMQPRSRLTLALVVPIVVLSIACPAPMDPPDGGAGGGATGGGTGGGATGGGGGAMGGGTGGATGGGTGGGATGGGTGGGATGGGTGGGATGGGGGAMGGGTGGGDADAGMPPAPPSLSMPLANAAVTSPVTVSGTAEANATVRVTISTGGTQVGAATGMVNSSGQFSVPTAFSAAGGAALVIEVIITNATGDSLPATVAVVAALPAPTITAPTAAASVASPLRVTGTAMAGASVTATLSAGATQLGMATGTAVSGAFSLSLPFTNQPASTMLTLSVTQTAGAATSPAATVSVSQASVFAVSGQISQTTGVQTGGTSVVIRAYASASEVLDFVAEQTLTATSGTALAATSYSFQLPPGSYTLRAFRDACGPRFTSAADGNPTLGCEAQAPGGNVAVSTGPVNGVDLDLADTSTVARYDELNAQTNHETAQPFPANGPGSGLCGGFYLQLTARTMATMGLTAPQARLPSGATVTLLDNGGCSGGGDNTSSSYDRNMGDGEFTFGIADPGAAQAGDYRFFFVNTAAGLVHAETDTLADIKKLSRAVWLTTTAADGGVLMSGADFNHEPTPALTWAPATGANRYLVQVVAGSVSLLQEVSNPSYAVPGSTALPDDTDTEVYISPRFVEDPLASVPDVDAVASPSPNSFFTDYGTPVPSVVVSGALILERPRPPGGFLFRLAGPFNVTARLPPTSTTYSFRVPLSPQCMGGSSTLSLQPMLDVEGSGNLDDLANYRTEQARNIDACVDSTQNFTWRPEARVLSPLPNATGVGAQPTITWESYKVTWETANPGQTLDMSARSYAVFLQSSTSMGFPDIIWALPGTATSFDFASPPAGTGKFDVVSLFSGGMGASLTSLASATQWSMGLAVLDCDYRQYVNNVPMPPPNDGFTQCISMVLGGSAPYAQSPEIRFAR